MDARGALVLGAMLYERWRAVARERGDALALCDLADGRRWSFARLAAATETGGAGDRTSWVFPQGGRAEFVLRVLEGWRNGQVVCPLEQGQTGPRDRELPEAAVHFKSTSGSTGAARGVWFAAEQLAADAEQIVGTMGLRPEWPNLATISLAHSYGFSNLVLPLLLHGIPLYLAPAPLPEVVRRAGAEVGALTLPAVPVLWRAWHEAGAIPGSTRLAISAGAPLPLELEAEIHARGGLKVHNFYGSTECGGIAYDGGSAPRSDARWVGTAMRGVRLTRSEEGCLVVHGAAVGGGYVPVSDGRLTPGRFHTLDLVDLAGEGVVLLGRAADTINVAGRKVHPDEIETVLRAWGEVRDCVVFGVPDGAAARGDTIVAWVVPRARAVDTGWDSRLRSYLLERLPAWKVPARLLVRDCLPVNDRGKISRVALREQVLEANRLQGDR